MFNNIQWVYVSLFILMILMPDITQSYEEIDFYGTKVTTSFWQLFLFGLPPSFFVFLFLFFIGLRLKINYISKPYFVLFLYFSLISVTISFFYGYIFDSFSRFISDFKVVIFFIGGLHIFDKLFKIERINKGQLVSTFFGFTISFLVGDLIFSFFNNIDTSLTSYKNLSYDSVKGLVIFPAYYAFLRIIQGERILFNFILLIFSLYLLIAYQTRWLYLTFFIGLILIMFFLEFKMILIYLTTVPILFFIILYFLRFFNNDILEIAIIRFSFINDLNSKSSLDEVDIVRAGSIYNSIYTLKDKFGFFWGLGYGSWFTDNYFSMSNLTVAAFEDSSIQIRRFYRVHDFFFNYLFKYGIIGILIYLNTFISPLYKLYKIKNILKKNTQYYITFLLLVGFTPTAITYFWFTGKGLLICSFFVSLLYYLFNSLLNNEKTF